MTSGDQLVASIDPSETSCFVNLSHCNNFSFWLGRLLWIRDDEGIHNGNEVCAWEKDLQHGAKKRSLNFRTRNGYKNIVQFSFSPFTSLKSNHIARLQTPIAKGSTFLTKGKPCHASDSLPYQVILPELQDVKWAAIHAQSPSWCQVKHSTLTAGMKM